MIADIELDTEKEEINMVRNGKNPYELRAELLVLAHRIVYDKNMNANGGTGVPPTTEEVIAEATKLNDFVSQRGADTHE